MPCFHCIRGPWLTLYDACNVVEYDRFEPGRRHGVLKGIYDDPGLYFVLCEAGLSESSPVLRRDDMLRC